MIGLFLPRLRVVSMLHSQFARPAPGLNRLMQPVARTYRNGILALIRNNEQDGSGHVSTRI
ncbi:hypothetical protein [Phyllobacterium myrsinacearum]|uniref:Uncharacterized protein n=1 Tax=Phyllobacterium myrsinacearum TaxID=28101 RepID=A0A839EGH9_9HYPH|nr:hypothetical protein [Phyllobacterium myrsinacearum]MBA8877488.1 hypothetical protein [Phyllobacterium myrsinacearum]